MIYVMPYIYMEGRIRKDGSVLFYVFSASGALKHHEDDWDIDQQKSEDRLTLK